MVMAISGSAEGQAKEPTTIEMRSNLAEDARMRRYSQAVLLALMSAIEAAGSSGGNDSGQDQTAQGNPA